ncbi:hypothetical protein BO78DRAFT_458425 [Aspergillus sclerotiicarbonarius CBS 121057]|uniref:DUF6536 domain-containing protein n=1 Tax=Aspergillus sclerotiicarbonarius (strain CBS 121057 / IBT 28362) TaxID=1448318 RepID=A0A319EMQ9_ASPSB|nr:hypothetical protein BO78DRAFT_458425 [Aspergillus sclerotiicarbonarius CBS 121057]
MSKWTCNNHSIQTQFSLPFSKTSAVQRPPDEEWIQGVLVGTWTAGGILILNIILALIAAGISYSQAANTRSLISTEVYNGHCTLSSRWATGIHIVINLLSTALLEASNYAMQCLSGPSRADVDKAHRKRRWLDIGVMSFRNFRAMTIKRKILWLVLLLSSVPIHMLYNSVIFSSITRFDYGIILVPEDLTPTDSLVGKDEASAFFDAVGSTPEVILTEIFNGTFQNVSNSECLEKYNVQFNTHLGTLILVAERQYFSNVSSLQATLQGSSSVYDYVKIVGKSRAEEAIEEGHWKAEGTDWDTYDYYDEPPSIPISHCMRKTMTQRCRLLFSPSIALAVILFNLAKVICMYLTARTDRSEIFLRVGDAVSSFLAKPDPTTEGRCLLSREDMTRGPYRWEPVPSWKSSIRRRIRRYRAEKPIDMSMETHHMLGEIPSSQETSPRKLPTRKLWFQAASKARWATALIMFSLCISISSIIYNMIQYDGWSLSEQWRLGFGQADSKTNIQFPTTNMILLVLISNSPQLVFSILYFICNTLLSCMLVTAEYNDYATQRKPLRVSWPQGDQRSTYYLSLPYRYSFPLFLLSVTLHWLLSESFFYVNISAYDVFGHFNQAESTRGCGFSPIAIFIILILEGVALFSLLALAIRPFKSPMPLAAHCSAAISAACHPPTGDRDAALKPVMWGEVASNLADDGLFPVDLAATNLEAETETEAEAEAAVGLMTKTTYAHCTFTSQEVTLPRGDRLYR